MTACESVFQKLRPSRRGLLAAGAAGVALSMPAIRRAAAQEKVLYINTWGGAWEEVGQGIPVRAVHQGNRHRNPHGRTRVVCEAGGPGPDRRL